MDCKDVRDDMLDVLYGEASEEAARRVAEHRQACSACRDETAALARLRRDLAQWTLPTTSPRRGLRLLQLAAGLLLAVGTALGLSGSELRFDQGRLSFRLGRGPDVQQVLREQEARHRTEIEALRVSLATGAAAPRDEAALLRRVQELVDASEARQAQLFRAGLQDVAQRSDTQRRYDLARVGASLAYLDGKTGQQVARTTELMGYLLQASDKR